MEGWCLFVCECVYLPDARVKMEAHGADEMWWDSEWD